MYKLTVIKKENGTIVPVTNFIKRISDNALIPFEPDNSDYQKYLKWVAEGNTPEPADSE